MVFVEILQGNKDVTSICFWRVSEDCPVKILSETLSSVTIVAQMVLGRPGSCPPKVATFHLL